MKKLSQGLVYRLLGLTVLGLVLIFLDSPRSPPPEEQAVHAPASLPAARTSSVSDSRADSQTVSAAPAAAQSSVTKFSLRVVSRPGTTFDHYATTSDALAALRPLAESGDVKAMLRIAVALGPCREKPFDEADIHAFQGAGIKAGVGPLLDEDALALTRSQSASFSRYCTTSQPEVFSEYTRWLNAAVDAGDGEAQVLASKFPPFSLEEIEKVRARHRRGEYDVKSLVTGETLERARRAAELAVRNGEVSGVLVARMLAESPIDQYVYDSLLAEINEGSDRAPERNQQLLKREAAALRIVDLEEAENRLTRLHSTVAEWIRRPPLPYPQLPTPDASSG